MVPPRRERRNPFTTVAVGRIPKKSVTNPMIAQPIGSGRPGLSRKNVSRLGPKTRGIAQRNHREGERDPSPSADGG